MFDCQVGWYALDRKGKVASVAEMKADPTLVTEAVKEDRASKYVGVDAWLDGTFQRATDRDSLTIYVKGRKGWKKIWTAPNTGEMKLEHVSLKHGAWFGHGCQLRIEMTAADRPANVGIDRLKITSVFMNNIQSLPYLLPGKNVLRVAAAEGADVKANPLTLKYVWEELGKARTLTKAIDKLPFETTLTVAGDEPPRMKSMTLSVAP